MFRIVGDQMTPRDVSVLKFLYSGTLCDELRSQINDGFTFLLALEKKKSVDESNFKSILDLLRIITRHDLTQYVTLRKRRTGKIISVNLMAMFDECVTYITECFGEVIVYRESHKFGLAYMYM